jgi:hypothetical protein
MYRIYMASPDVSCSFNGVNLSANQCTDIITKYTTPSGIDGILNNPFFWIVVTAAIIMIGLWFIFGRKGKGDPSQQPFWGRKVRNNVLNEETAERIKDLGQKCKYHLRHGSASLGLADRIEHDFEVTEKVQLNPRTKQAEVVPGDNYKVERMRYRKYGIWPRIKSWFGFGYKYITLTPDARYIFPTGKKQFYYIDAFAHLLADSKVWTLSTSAAYRANENLLLKANNEDLHGHFLDNLRKQSVFSAQTAAKLEEITHNQRMKEQDRKSRESGFV